MSGSLALEIRGLRKFYGPRAALDGLDMAVPEGTIYGFLGPNGAGKTTTLRIVAALVSADAGRIELLGRPFDRRDRRHLFEVGALIETPSFYPYLSGRRNLESLAATGAPVPRSRIDEVLELVGMRDRAGDRLSTYSLGMRQRLGIAAALLSDPRLLLLDEPANGLDPAGIVGMRQTLRNAAAAGKTVLVSSHILAEVGQLADIVGIIAAGRLVREASMDALLRESGRVRVRVQPAQVDDARAALARFGVEPVVAPDDDGAWLTVATTRDRASDVTRALASADIYVSGLETSGNLEELFLRLTGTGTGEP